MTASAEGIWFHLSSSVNLLNPTISVLAFFVTAVGEQLVLVFGRSKTLIRACRVRAFGQWPETGATVVTKALLVIVLFAGLGLWFVLSLPSHVYMAVSAVALALICGACLRD